MSETSPGPNACAFVIGDDGLASWSDTHADAWIGLLETHKSLTRVLDAELEAEHGLSLRLPPPLAACCVGMYPGGNDPPRLTAWPSQRRPPPPSPAAPRGCATWRRPCASSSVRRRAARRCWWRRRSWRWCGSTSTAR